MKSGANINPTRKASRSLASARAYDYLRDAIYGGRLMAGEVVTEDDVASAVGVSRTPVREALRRASADGFLELEGFRRARVSNFSDEDTKDLFEIRAVLEALAAERAATRISSREIEHLERLTDSLESVKNEEGASLFRQFGDFNSAFHSIILKASGSRQIMRALEHLIETPLILHKRFEGTLVENIERTIHHHRGIITALRAADAKWAHAEMTAHLMAARSSLEVLRTSPEDGSSA